MYCTTMFHMIIDKKYSIFSLKLPFSKKNISIFLSTIFFKNAKIALCYNLLELWYMHEYVQYNSSKVVLIL